MSPSSALHSATDAPVIAAVRVPPSAWRTSQSTMTVRGPSALRSTTERRERPIRRWISWVRPPTLARSCPSVCVWLVEACRIPAVTHPA